MLSAVEIICWDQLVKSSAEIICWIQLLTLPFETMVDITCWNQLVSLSFLLIIWGSVVEMMCWHRLLRLSVERNFGDHLLSLSAEILCSIVKIIRLDPLWDYLLRSSVEIICSDQMLRWSVEINCWDYRRHLRRVIAAPPNNPASYLRGLCEHLDLPKARQVERKVGIVAMNFALNSLC